MLIANNFSTISTGKGGMDYMQSHVEHKGKSMENPMVKASSFSHFMVARVGQKGPRAKRFFSRCSDFEQLNTHIWGSSLSFLQCFVDNTSDGNENLQRDEYGCGQPHSWLVNSGQLSLQRCSTPEYSLSLILPPHLFFNNQLLSFWFCLPFPVISLAYTIQMSSVLMISVSSICKYAAPLFFWRQWSSSNSCNQLQLQIHFRAWRATSWAAYGRLAPARIFSGFLELRWRQIFNWRRHQPSRHSRVSAQQQQPQHTRTAPTPRGSSNTWVPDKDRCLYSVAHSYITTPRNSHSSILKHWSPKLITKIEMVSSPWDVFLQTMWPSTNRHQVRMQSEAISMF